MKQREILNRIAPDFARDGQGRRDFIAQKRDRLTDYIRRFVDGSGMKGVALGVSGGVDSFLVGALCARALRDTGKALYLAALPCGDQADLRDALDSMAQIREIYPAAVCDTVNIRAAYDGTLDSLGGAAAFSRDPYTLGNLQARLRMVCQYALAQGMLVAGTDHAAESAVGFFTKYGDGGTDFNPIAELLKDDIYELAAWLDAPRAVLQKKPAAGLGISADDESEMGISYTDICAYLRGNVIAEGSRQKLERMYGVSRHKRSLPASPQDEAAPKRGFTILVVDLIHAFTDGEMACQNADGAVRNTVRYVNAHPEANVLYACDLHPEDHCSFTRRGGPRPAHAVRGTRSAELEDAFYREIKKTVNTPLLRYNVFHKGEDAEREQYSGLEAQNGAYGPLRANLTERVAVVGAATEYCVLNTVIDLTRAGHEVWLAEDCLAYVAPEGHARALARMRGMGARITYGK